MDHVPPAHSPFALRQDNAPPPILFDELAFDILSWLPVKSLVRFKCVCQYWKSFISDPNFIKEHRQKSPKNSYLILRLRGRMKFAQSCSVSSSLKNASPIIITEALSIPYNLQENYNYNTVGTCNGLVCLVQSNHTTRKLEICVWNPATRLVSENSIYLFDMTRYPCYYLLLGFGYDNLTDTYKVVLAVLDGLTKKDPYVKVYSLVDNCLRNVQSLSFPFVGSPQHVNGVYLNGTLNWLLAGHFNSNQFENWFIVSLDMGKETHTQLFPPCDLEALHYGKSILGVFMDCLCLSYGYKEGTHIVLWQMKEFGVQKSWTRLLNVSFQDIPIHDVGYASFSPLRMYENGDILIMMSFSDKIILYNPRDNRAEHIITFSDFIPIKAMDYVQSLVLPS